MERIFEGSNHEVFNVDLSFFEPSSTRSDLTHDCEGFQFAVQWLEWQWMRGIGCASQRFIVPDQSTSEEPKSRLPQGGDCTILHCVVKIATTCNLKYQWRDCLLPVPATARYHCADRWTWVILPSSCSDTIFNHCCCAQGISADTHYLCCVPLKLELLYRNSQILKKIWTLQMN